MLEQLRAKREDGNVAEPERWLSMIGGGTLLAYGIGRRDRKGVGLALLGGALLHRGVTGHCNIYQALGVNTARAGQPGVPYELGVRVDEEVRIDKPREEVYRFWRNLENLPRFMDNLQSVRVLDDRTSEWTTKAPAGMTVSWKAEIVNEVENEVIGWRSLPGSTVDVGGSVRFEDAPGGGTRLMVSLQYNPPAGTLGKAVAQLAGQDPAGQISHDLHCFKELMETGSISRQARSRRPAGPLRTEGKQWNRDAVSDSSEESFPASDSPSWTPETLSSR